MTPPVTLRVVRPGTPQASASQDAAHSDFARDMLAALASRPRSISPKYFYDAAGSAYFDAICELPEYYPTRTEVAILRSNAAAIASHIGPHAELLEFGAGSLHKVRLLLDAMDRPAGFVPIDISGEHLTQAAHALAQAYPGLLVQPLVADYTQQLVLPEPSAAGKRVGFFPGSTIGNFNHDEALAFLRMACHALRGGALLLGADLVKDPAILHAAYNDAQGVTAAFNLNLLTRANRELQADFDVSKFFHSAFYNAPLRRIEMHLVSRCWQQVHVCGQHFEFEEGQSLHTESSYKFTMASMRALAQQAGFEPGQVWTDSQQRFSLHWLMAPR
ncbi:MAG: L-histidine N(alpha)-methyltransferase [Burkholderiales bacterium]